ncbi:hypothetical protein F3Y22_tig00112243pilonHSYRG00015 [Hibiscus syriacus]|uniref:BURP domain-containing protein n=2 Tax=Hibiscus syriacus TaxID=106335 RepID=A0A6A2Y7Q7_HIBSY|nr:BURP domain-containing protein 3-like [Hibiscus syriacus]KAE8669399.1 hypothetical protein F3Y22_tig00112243pilonHSYRG00015 [Hibiscus syriacus]
MGNEFVSCSFLLLLFVSLAPRVTSNGADVLRLHSMDSDDNHSGGEKNGRGSSSGGGWAVSMDDPNDPAVQVFALIKDLVVGKTMPIYFPYIKDPTSFQFFPKETTQHIPFSSEAIPELLRFFSFSPDSKQALGMRQTLEVCEKEPKEGEVRGCATNVESLADFARGILGSDSKVEILRSSLLSNPSTPLVQNYTILEFAEMSTGDIVPCHSEPYPYPVYYCHFQLGAESKVFKVHLRGENGEMIDSAFLCHMDTSTWRPGHVAFRLLGVKAGDTEVCHFMAAHDLAMFPVPK